MDTRLIYEFSELATKLSITETAHSLNMSQPTLSKHISQLEKDLHITLFRRSPNGLRLTREGLELLNSAYALIEADRQFVEKANSLRANPLPHLSVAGLTSEEAVVEFLSETVSSLSAKYGPNFLEVESTHHCTPIKLVQSGAVDIAFDYADSSDFQDCKDVETIALQKIRWYAVVNSTHPFYSRDSISIDDLDGRVLMKMEGTHLCDVWPKMEETIRKHGVDPILRRQYSMRLIDLITASARLGMSILILSENFAKRVVPNESPFIKAIPFVDDDAFTSISGLFRMDNSNPILDELLALLADTRNGAK